MGWVILGDKLTGAIEGGLGARFLLFLLGSCFWDAFTGAPGAWACHQDTVVPGALSGLCHGTLP